MFCFLIYFLNFIFYLLKSNILILLKKLMTEMAATALFMYDNVLITFCILKPLLKNNIIYSITLELLNQLKIRRMIKFK